MTMPPSGDQPAYVDPVTGQPLFIDPATGQLVYTDPTAAVPQQPTGYAPLPPYPSAPPTYPGYATPAGFPEFPAGDPSVSGIPAAGYTAPAYPPSGYGQPGYGYPGYGYPMQALQRRANSMALTAMILSIVGAPLLFCDDIGGPIGLTGAILGHVARRQIKRRNEDGGSQALAGIIVGWCVTGIAVLILAVIIALVVANHN